MIALEVSHNGKVVAIDGDTRTGMASFNLTTQYFEEGDKLERAYAAANGFYGDSHQYLSFSKVKA